MRGRADAEEALRPQARAGSYQAAARRSGEARPQVTAMAVVLGLRTVGPRASLRPFKLLTRSQDAAGTGPGATAAPRHSLSAGRIGEDDSMRSRKPVRRRSRRG